MPEANEKNIAQVDHRNTELESRCWDGEEHMERLKVQTGKTKKFGIYLEADVICCRMRMI